MPGVAPSAPTAGPAYVRLRGLDPLTVGRLKWWARLSREARAIARRGDWRPRHAIRALRLARAGFLPASERFYDLEAGRIDDYVSDRQREETWALDWPAAGLLDDKLAFYFMLHTLGVPTPELVGVIVRGRANSLRGNVAEEGDEWLRRRLAERGRLVVRPTRGGGGRGLWVVESAADGYRANGDRLDRPGLERLVAGLHDHVVSDWVGQAGYARRLHPRTTNTLRFLTMTDAGGPFIASAVHRIGTAASAPADNWSQGGLSAPVDLDTGTLGPGVPYPRQGPLRRFDRHPETGETISGAQVPRWREVRDGILAAAGLMPFLPYVGWDVIVTEDGFTVIEGNKFSDVNLLQVHGPLLTDPRVRDFYEKRGVVR